MQLKDTHIEDIEDLIPIIEDSFGFKCADGELLEVNTFGQLCDIVVSKLQHLDNSNDCTAQQAFYKLRAAIAIVLQIDKSTISTDTRLQILFPRLSRRQSIKQVERQLGVQLNILRPRHFITYSLSAGFFLSLVALRFDWKVALLGIIFDILGFIIAFKFANTLDLQTVGQAADKMSRESYLKSRRNSLTINKREIENKIRDLFSDRLSLPKTALTRDADLY